jgi:hypothetical protein
MTVPADGEPNAQISVAIRADAIRDLYLETILGAGSAK